MNQQTPNEISLKDIVVKISEWAALFKKKWLVICLTASIGGVLGLGYAYTQKPLYLATLSFAIEDEKVGGGGLSGALGLASQFGIDLGSSGGSIFSGSNLMELMKSRTLIQKALLRPIQINGKQTSTAELYIKIDRDNNKNANNDLESIRFLKNRKDTEFTLQQNTLLGGIYQDIKNNKLSVVPLNAKAGIINIVVKSGSELFSKTFAEVLAMETSEFYIETKTAKSAQNLSILQKQVDSVRSELYGAITGVAASTDNIYNLNPSLVIKRVPSTKKQVDVQFNTAILTQLVTNLEIAKVTVRKETPLIQVIDRPILPLPVMILGKMKALFLGIIFGTVLSMLFVIIRRAAQN